MPSRTGWALLTVGVTALLAGRLLSAGEITLVGVALTVLVAAALVRAVASNHDLHVRRDIVPPRVHAGDASHVEFTVHNAGRRRTPVLQLVDHLGTRPTTALGLSALRSGEGRSAGYRLSTDRRGLIEVGPLEAVDEDPFGLTRTSWEVAGTTSVRVLPRIEHLDDVADPGIGGEATGSALKIGSGGDFHALRPYVPGDDLRLVDWGATARRDEPLIRQFAEPARGRCLVVADLRTARTGEGSFEQLVSAAASVAVHAGHGPVEVGLATSGDVDISWLSGRTGRDALLDRLSVVEPGDQPTEPVIEKISLERSRGTRVLVLTRRGAAAPDSLVGLGEIDGVSVVLFHGTEAASGGAAVTPLAPGAGFAAAWNGFSRSPLVRS